MPGGGAALHEATALWDVKTAVDSEREVKPVEQHIHSFLESLPFAGLASLMGRCHRATARSRCAVRALPEQGKSFPGKDVEPSCVSRF